MTKESNRLWSKIFCLFLAVCLIFSCFSGYELNAYAAESLKASDFTFIINGNSFSTVPEDGENILYVSEQFVKYTNANSDKIKVESSTIKSFTVSYQKSGTSTTIETATGSVEIAKQWCNNKTTSEPIITITAGESSIVIKVKPYASIEYLHVKEDSGRQRPLSVGNSHEYNAAIKNLSLIMYADSTTKYETTATKEQNITIEPSIKNKGTYEIWTTGDNPQKVGDNVAYTYKVEKDETFKIVAKSAKDFAVQKEYYLNVKAADSEYFPENTLQVKESETNVDIGTPTYESGKWCYSSSSPANLKQGATATITASDGASDDITYTWKHTIKGVEQSMTDSSAKTVAVDTDTFGFNGIYELSATRIVEGCSYTTTIQLPYTLTGVTHIDKPTITTQPVSASYKVGNTSSALSVKATSLLFTDASKLRYQWYRSSTNNTTAGTAIEGATSSTYSLPAFDNDSAGTTYYYCTVKAYYTPEEGQEIESEAAVSDVATITVEKNDFPWGGNGTESNPYRLENTEDLTQLRDLVNAGNAMNGIYFKMTEDISLPANWTPIGCLKDKESKKGIDEGKNLWAFSGNIDGNGKTLTVPEGEKPLLGYVKGASVKNLNIYGTKINGYGLVNNFEGVGLSGTAITIDNVTLKSGTQTLKSGLLGANITTNGYAGVSADFVAVIKNCTIEKDVVIGYDGNQGLIGSFAGRMQGTIENCTSAATVKGTSYVGGIIGTRDNAMGNCIVKNCTFSGNVEASGDNAGGIAGGGYVNSSAPNGIKISILACKVTGNVKGVNNVGGILGGDNYVAQAWNEYSFLANTFSGKVSGEKNVGAIIGYYKSLNNLDNIAANLYTKVCGAKNGIGTVEYVDTNYNNPTSVSGTTYFSTEKGVADCPTVKWCDWKTNYNRTDDPLGKDKEKLTEAVDEIPDTAFCYELTINGTPKAEYYIGDDLDFSNVTFTAKWTDGKETHPTFGTSEDNVKATGYNKSSNSVQTITLSYGYAQTSIQVAVLKKASGDAKKDTLTVSFKLLGDSKHDSDSDKKVHGLANGGLTTWTSGTYEVPLNSTVWNLMQKVQSLNSKVTFNAKGTKYGTYVYSVTYNGTELGEFDNGKKSGWMYTVNGTHPEVSVGSKFLNNGDTVVFHYTDDYTVEEGSDKWTTDTTTETVDKVTTTGTTGSATTTTPTETKVTEKTAADGTKEKVATVTVTTANQKELLKQAKANKSKEIVLQVAKDSMKDASKAEVQLDKSFVNSILNDTDATVTVETPLGNKTYTQAELKELAASATGSTITLTVDKSNASVDTTDELDVKAEVAKLTPVARSSKTAKKNIKVTTSLDKNDKAIIAELKDAGYTVKYRFYRSTKKASSYKAKLTGTTGKYTNTAGKKGTRYYYKVQLRVYDQTGKLVAKTALKQCKYATRIFG